MSYHDPHGGGPPQGWGPHGQQPQQQQPQQQQPQQQQPQQQPQQQQWQQPQQQQQQRPQQQQQQWPQQQEAGQHLPGQQSPLKMAGSGCIFLVAITGTLVVLFTGLGDMLNDWQADVLGGWYYPQLTFLLVFVVLLVPPLAIFNLVLKATGKDKAG